MSWFTDLCDRVCGRKKPTVVTQPEPVVRDTTPSEPAIDPSFKVGQIGVDISHHNDDVNLDELVENVDFIYMKATEGTSFVSNVYNARAEKLNRIGKVPWGAYHYYKIDKDPVKQAEHFLKYIDVKSGLPPVLDIERINNENYKYYKHTNDLLIFLKIIEEKTGITPIIYTNFFFARDKIKPSEEFKRYPLWLAWYTKDFSRVKIPEPWDVTLIWQKTEYGRIEGVNGHVDVNVVV